MLRIPIFSQTAPTPSLAETFDWMANTLKPSERNNSFTHYPTPHKYVQKWIDEEINPFHRETIENFSHDGCRVTFEVEMVDNDMGFLLGKVFLFYTIDTFDLRDIDPHSVRIQDSCKPVETGSGPVEPWNCADTQGRIVVFQTVDAKAKIHEESHGSSSKSDHGYWQVNHHEKLNLDYMCKEANANGDSGNGAYCDQPDKKQAAKDLTSLTLGFSTAEYTARFEKALRHSVELCGGKASAF
jgi:hypothetical protein